MKKRFWVYTTILALILTFSVLFVSVYAALSQNISIKNTISFAGTDEVVKFSVDAKVTGTKNDEILKTSWKYDYDDLDCPNTFDWDIGNIEFASEGKTIDQINITYTFVVTNQSSCPILAEFDGPNKHYEGGDEGEIIEGLIGTHYVSLTDSRGVEKKAETKGKYIELDLNDVATLKFVLTLKRIDNYSCNENIDFKILFSAVTNS
ncbi:MAG: hypothetical protein MR904_04105 [Clostridia bacterium]|nr:hypothetical protein [Clostridia bacterium]